MGLRDQSKMYQSRYDTYCPRVSEYCNRYLNTVVAGTPIMETEYVDKAKVSADRHILPWWIVRFRFIGQRADTVTNCA